jgi:hypothetical protein
LLGIQKLSKNSRGSDVEKYGICPVYTDDFTNGINCGKNGGRICWIISGTDNNGKNQRINSNNFLKCMKCDFHNLVQKEEGKDFKSAKDIYILFESKYSL